MALVNLMELQPNSVSRDIRDYSILLFGDSGLGKTPFIHELFGDRVLFLSFEQSQKGISGAYAVDIDSYATLMYYIGQLENPQIREKFDAVCIDTLFLFDYMCEKSVTDAYGKDLIRDCLAYNQAYKIIDKRFLTALKRLQKMNYSMIYVAHPVEKKVKLQDGTEMTRLEPKVSDRVKNLLLPEIDIRLFGAQMPDGSRKLFSRSTAMFDARCRVGIMDAEIDFDAEALKKAFADGVDRIEKNGGMVSEQRETKHNITDERPFEVVYQEVMALGQELQKAGRLQEGMQIITQELGHDEQSRPRTLDDVNETMTPALEVIAVRLKELLNK